jgi:hypothetical protein
VKLGAHLAQYVGRRAKETARVHNIAVVTRGFSHPAKGLMSTGVYISSILYRFSRWRAVSPGLQRPIPGFHPDFRSSLAQFTSAFKPFHSSVEVRKGAFSATILGVLSVWLFSE